jgi:hypothetical protein
MENSSLASQAFAPLDYSGTYGNVAKTMVGAGQVINQSMNDFATFEKTRDKEKLRQQAVQEVLSKKPYLSKVIRPDIPVEELGKGLAQLGAGSILYDQLQKSGADYLPDKSQFEQAVFAASPEAFVKLQADWEKRLTGQQEDTAQAKVSGQVGAAVAELPPEATKEDIARHVTEKGLNLKDFAAKDVLLASGRSEKDLALEDYRKKRLILDSQKAAAYRQKVGDDKFYSDLNKAQGSILALDTVIKNKDALENKAIDLSNQMDRARSHAEQTATTFNEQSWLDKISEVHKKVSERDKLVKGALRIAKTATKEFGSRYPGAMTFTPEIELMLGGEGAAPSSAPEPAAAPAAPGAPAKGSGFGG